MNSLFSFTNKYRSDLGREEVLARINDLLKTKSKFLFFSVHQYFGSVSESEFTLTRQRFDWWGMMSSRLNGSVFTRDGTIVHTRITIPWLIVIIFFAILPAKLMERKLIKLLNLQQLRELEKRA